MGGPHRWHDNQPMPIHPRQAFRPRDAAPSRALTEQDVAALQQALDRVPAPFEPLDVSMLDGFLCGVLLQPQRIPESRWLPHVTDVEGRVLPPGFDAAQVHAWTRRRHAELDRAIGQRQWFDPWVFELDDDVPGESSLPAPSQAVYPWVAGFATALELFPALMALDADRLNEPLALLYRHLEPDDLEDADALLEAIEELEPPAELADAVEELVRATLLLADICRPRAASGPPHRRRPTRR
jgi:uncharacterized protein